MPSSPYWLDLEVPTDLEVARLDDFLRDIWVECHDHMSNFTVRAHKSDHSLTTYRRLKVMARYHWALTIVNSPRTGVCSYAGSTRPDLAFEEVYRPPKKLP